MREIRKTRKWRIAVLTLTVLCLLSACGQGAAASMHLIKAQGEVGVSDGDGKEVSLMEGLGLYDGYQVGTQQESY